jgi:signal transduction protein with GAF and PtsI domain
VPQAVEVAPLLAHARRAATSASQRDQQSRGKSPQKSRISNGTALLPGVDGRSAWYRRAKDLIAEFASDIPDASAAERSLVRRCAVLTVQLEQIEQRFAKADGNAEAADLDLYQKIANTLRRHLSTLGLQRRQKLVGPSLGEVLRAGIERESPC